MLGTEEAALASLPGQLRAVVVVVPRDEAYTTHLEQREAEAGVGVQYTVLYTVLYTVQDSEHGKLGVQVQDPRIFFIQHTGAMCGTAVLIHALVTG